MTHSATEVADLEAAWRWVLRLRDEQTTAEDLAEWLQWYEADERHRRAFEEMQSFWHETGKLADDDAASVLALADSRGFNKHSSRRGPWCLFPALAAGLLFVVVGLGLALTSGRPAHPPLTADVRETRLPDGSTVDLAPKSNVTSHYTDSSRLLVMEGEAGEAYFSVASNPHRPFVVQVGAMRVRALGTAFNVRRAEDRIVVSVTHGVVEIFTQQQRDGAGDSVKVAAGNRLVWRLSADGEPSIEAATEASTLAWQQGRLEYHNEPLASVIADVNRYSRQPIVIGDAAAADILFSGTVFTQATDAWIDALPQVFPVTVEQRLTGGLRVTSVR